MVRAPGLLFRINYFQFVRPITPLAPPLTPRRYASYYLAAKETPRGKVLTKEDARAIVDGSFFPAVAADLEAGRLERRSLFTAGLTPLKAPKAGGKAGEAGGKAGELRKEL